MLLALRGVTRRFPGVVALDSVDFDLEPGEVHVVSGENGAGKSTLLRIVSGADRPDAGQISIDGERASFAGPKDALERGVAAVYQEGTLAPHLGAADNVVLGREPTGAFGIVDRARARDVARRALADLGAADLDLETPVARLGIAARQLVEVARALAQGGRILCLDEPTASLTGREVPALFEAIARLRAKGVGILYVSHRLEEFARIGDRVTVLRNGKKVWTRPVAEAPVGAIVEAMAGEGADARVAAPSPPGGEALLDVEGLSSGTVEGATLRCARGEIVGIAGLVGSGRSELLRAIFGAAPIRAGRVRFEGQPVRFDSPRDAVAAGIGFVPEDRKAEGLAPGLSVATNVTLASLDRFRARLGLDLAREEKEVGLLADRLSIRRRSVSQPVGELSGGNQQKTLLARWLCRGAKLLLLDEPAAGVDVGARAELYRQVTALAASGVGVVVVASYLPELLAVCHRIVVLHRGRIAGEVSAGAGPDRIVALMTGGPA